MKFIKNNLRVIIPLFIAVILIVAGVVLLTIEKDKDEGANDIQINENKEQQITDITGMSSDDAISLVKKNFDSNNYEYKALITEDSFYKVIVKNTIDNSEIIYYVDPSNSAVYVSIDNN